VVSIWSRYAAATDIITAKTTPQETLISLGGAELVSASVTCYCSIALGFAVLHLKKVAIGATGARDTKIEIADLTA